MKSHKILFLVSFISLTLTLFGVDALSSHGLKVKGLGPNVNQSRGEPWPMPQHRRTHATNFMVVRPSLFRFEIVNNTCDIVEQALKRYYAIILQSQVRIQKIFGKSEEKSWKDNEGYRGYLDVLMIDLLTPCEFMPHEEMDESYKLKIDSMGFPQQGILRANTNWGILRGLETFSQLLHPTYDHSAIRIRSTWVHDFPRFSFRSVLIDTARHFISKKVLFQNLDLMAMNKMNVFHWHIVDDQSFPYQSKLFPELSDKGAYHPFTHVYTQYDIAEIIEYARLRGIRVVPEFDSPGHTQSWGPAVPRLLTTCYSNTSSTDGQIQPDGTFGPIDPTQIENYEFLKKLFAEVASVFPDKYVHLGGDEVDFTCWQSNPDIQAFMKARGFTDFSELEGLYMQNLVEIVESLPENKTYIVWQEVIDNGVKVNDKTLINVWKGDEFDQELDRVTSKGYRSLLYACWYLDQVTWGIDWPRYYKCDPQKFNGTEEQMSLVLGGGAAMWAEFVDSTNLIPLLWPRAAAPAERLWSNASVNETDEAAPRMEEQRCRLLQRGFNVKPANGPGYCLVSWD